MTRSTRRTGLPRASALLFTLALGVGWSQSASVFAYSTAESGGAAPAAPFLADTRFNALPFLGAASFQAFEQQLESLRAATAGAAGVAAAQPQPLAKAPAKTTSQPKASAKPKATVQTAAPKLPTYTGQNRFWIPSLGMNDKVHLFECSRSRDPDNYIYRWGCAGTNNVYILGHAWGVMKSLHDLYVRGGLRKGMVAIYADGAGRVHWYKVTSWRVVDPADSAWAIASQPVPSMTLQTCVGKDGRYRLNVRLVQYKVT